MSLRKHKPVPRLLRDVREATHLLEQYGGVGRRLQENGNRLEQPRRHHSRTVTVCALLLARKLVVRVLDEVSEDCVLRNIYNPKSWS